MHFLHDDVRRKFTGVYNADEWLIETDTGYQPLIDVKQTIEYEVWELVLSNGYSLKCADDHIVFYQDHQEVFVKDLVIGDIIVTDHGLVSVVLVNNLGYTEHMYDVGVDSTDHRYYSDGILSHNTTCASAYLLWYAMFIPDQTILIAAHKFSGAQEIMQRIRYAYESCPDYIRAGVTSYNKGSLEFDNGSRIVSQTTTITTGRGMSISLLYLDEYAHVSPSIASDMWTSIAPTLSTGGKAIITSTPNSDEDQFAEIWKGSQDRFDEFGNELTEGVGSNGFYGYTAPWDSHPDRDEEWKQNMISQIGVEKFRREYQCLGASTMVTVQDTTGKIFKISLKELHEGYMA